MHNSQKGQKAMPDMSKAQLNLEEYFKIFSMPPDFSSL